MKKVKVRVLLIFTSILSAFLGSQYNSCDKKTINNVDSIQVYFSPDRGCTSAIVREINSASKTILVQAYSFTSEIIANALIKAAERGVVVKCIMDRRETEGLGNKTIVLWKNIADFAVDTPRGLSHSKVMVIDDKTVITGSFNFSKAAEVSNVENLLIIRNTNLAKEYTDHWYKRREQSTKYSEQLREEIKNNKEKSKKNSNKKRERSRLL